MCQTTVGRPNRYLACTASQDTNPSARLLLQALEHHTAQVAQQAPGLRENVRWGEISLRSSYPVVKHRDTYWELGEGGEPQGQKCEQRGGPRCDELALPARYTVKRDQTSCEPQGTSLGSEAATRQKYNPLAPLHSPTKVHPEKAKNGEFRLKGCLGLSSSLMARLRFEPPAA
ncbi:hypothetical protein CCM_05611 [Cordyceps militaris CM01]|uniref:Uncharacterized protein n=1 Tax=Cordyceps militaris (strain CM01) TaxID=983644 RepID=G3JKL4_CORMM|nr:uncharacterized protein CCM_05611 [Cordyceps militaris CM01]EGX91453.1 hypothetical protein CCM_05611 [Cordyceps militaris CM01]